LTPLLRLQHELLAINNEKKKIGVLIKNNKKIKIFKKTLSKKKLFRKKKCNEVSLKIKQKIKGNENKTI